MKTGSSQLFLTAKKTGVYSKLINESSFVVVGEQWAHSDGALSFLVWISVLPCLVCQRCLWLSAGAGRAQWVMQSKLLHGWLMWGAVCPAPCGRENTPGDGCQTSGDLVPMNISPGSIYIFLWLVLTVAVVELSAERKK